MAVIARAQVTIAVSVVQAAGLDRRGADQADGRIAVRMVEDGTRL